MNIESVNGYTLIDLNKISVVLGKNGCGKSTMLRRLEQGLRDLSNQNIVSGQHMLTKGTRDYGESRYITPERGGTLTYRPPLLKKI